MKVFLHPQTNRKENENLFLSIESALNDNGIYIAKNKNDADIYFLTLHENLECFYNHTNIVLFISGNSDEINPEPKINHENVKMIFVRESTKNHPMYLEHLSILEDAQTSNAKWNGNIPIIVSPAWHHEPFLRKICVEPDWNKNRHLKINAQCNPYCYLTSLTNHRLALHNIIHKTYNVSCNKTDLVNYWNNLSNTRILVSPWGDNVSCYKDVEAIYKGCVLIKPYSDFAKTYGNLFQSNRFYVSCNSDWSNLVEKIEYINTNYDAFLDMRVSAYQHMYDSFQPNNMAIWYKTIFESIL